MEYLTVSEYALKYDVPKRTVRYWVKHGKLKAVGVKRPMRIPDDQPVPKRNRSKGEWYYSWDIL